MSEAYRLLLIQCKSEKLTNRVKSLRRVGRSELVP
jgi:hypothetical protein